MLLIFLPQRAQRQGSINNLLASFAKPFVNLVVKKGESKTPPLTLGQIYAMVYLPSFENGFVCYDSLAADSFTADVKITAVPQGGRL